METAEISTFEQVSNAILILRKQKVMIDADLARIYQVPTKRLNQAVKRNPERFPPDFMFKLNEKEKDKLVTEHEHLHNLKYSPYLPYAFTEHGALMLASVLNSPAAVKACVHVIRAFVKMREIIQADQKAFEEYLSERLEKLELQTQERFEGMMKAIQTLKEEEK